MKNGKRPTKKQKIAIKLAGFDPDNWLVVKNFPEKIFVVHRYTNTKKDIPLL